MIERVISGGQTGADQGALRAAKACGLATGGWAPKGWLTESGPAPWLASYGLVECPEGRTASEVYVARRRRCVMDCDVALLFGDRTSNGSRGLIRDCEALGKAWVHVEAGIVTPRQVVEFLAMRRARVLLCAGNRESIAPGIGDRVEAFLIRVFRLLRCEGGER